MLKTSKVTHSPRIAHYFRDVDLAGASCPEFIPEAFPVNCDHPDNQWPGELLLRMAIRSQHVWPTFGMREGKRTIEGDQPAVCFTDFNLADLIAVRNGLSVKDPAVRQYALTFPAKVARRGGISPVQDMTSVKASHSEGIGQICSEKLAMAPVEWRWIYAGNYDGRIARIEDDGFDHCPIPGLKLTLKKWAGIGVVVPDLATALKVQYDIISLIDRNLVSPTHFDHILVCDQLPASLDGLSDVEIQRAVSKACFDFKKCMDISNALACLNKDTFSGHVSLLDRTTPRGELREEGMCWLWFEDSTHAFVRSLVAVGRITVDKQGRYLASLDELDELDEHGHKRDLRERELIATKLSEVLKERWGLRSCYFSVVNSKDPNSIPCYAGDLWGFRYCIE